MYITHIPVTGEDIATLYSVVYILYNEGTQKWWPNIWLEIYYINFNHENKVPDNEKEAKMVAATFGLKSLTLRQFLPQK